MEKETGKISSYAFKQFLENEENNNVFQFKNLGQREEVSKKTERIYLQEELKKEGKLGMFPFITEQKDRKEILSKINEEKYQLEITNRLKIIEKEYIKRAYEEGLKIARTDLSKEFEEEVGKKLDSLTEMLRNALSLRDEIFRDQKDQIIFLIKSLTKWVIIKELKDDGRYLEKLLEKLIEEIQAKQNFVIQVSQKDFEKTTEILKNLEKKMGEFKNSRVIVDYDLPENGIVIDSENGMIKSTLDGQFKVLDELFDKM